MSPADALFLVWGPPSHGPRSKVFARELGIDVEFVEVTKRRGLLVAPYKYLMQTVRTVRLLRRRRPRLVFVQSPPSLAVWVVGAYAALTGADFVVDAHSAAMLADRWTRPRWLNRMLARRAVVTIVTNEHFAAQLEERGARALVVRDIPTSFPSGPSPDLPAGFNVLVVNTFNFDEPLAEVVDAARRSPDVTFHVSGRIGANRLPDAPPNVRFTDFLPDDDYYALMARADAVVCLTTRDHTMQRGACEALSMGRPIITSDSRLLRDYFHQGTIHVDNSVDAIADAVERMRSDHGRYRTEIDQLRRSQREQWRVARERLGALIDTGHLSERTGS